MSEHACCCPVSREYGFLDEHHRAQTDMSSHQPMYSHTDRDAFAPAVVYARRLRLAACSSSCPPPLATGASAGMVGLTHVVAGLPG